MSQLADDFALLVMDRSGHLFEPRNHVVVMDTQLTGAGLADFLDIGMTADNQSDTAFGQRFHQVDQLGRAAAVFGSQTFPGCRAYKSVLQFQAVYFREFKQAFLHRVLLFD